MLKHILSSFFVRLMVAIINFTVLIILSKQLGSSIVGEMSLMILNMAIVQTVVEIYTGSTLIYFIPKFSFFKIYRSGIIWIVVITAICNFIFYFFQIGANHFGLHVFILSLILCVNSFHSIILLANEKIKQFNAFTLLQPVLILTALIYNLFVKHDYSEWSFISAWYFSFFILFIYSIVALITSKIYGNNSDFSLKKIIANGLVNQLANLSHTLSNRLNYYLLGSASLIGVYANSTSMIESLWIISASISPLILTHVANQRNEEKQGQLTLLLSKICFLMSLFGILILYLLPNSFFVFLLGQDFIQTKTVMLYLSPGVLMISFSSIISHYFSGQGMQRIQLTANLSGLVVAGLSSYFFIQQFGIIGACLSASLSYTTQALVLTFAFIKRNDFRGTSLFSLMSDWKYLQKDN